MFPSSGPVWLPGWYHILGFGVFIPILAWRSKRRLIDTDRPLPARVVHFRSTAITLTVFTALSLLIANAEDIDLFPAAAPSFVSLVAGLAMYAAALVVMRPRWRRAVERRARIVYLYMPDNATERAWWGTVSTLAGVGEEITWRGVQTAMLATVTGSYLLACVLSAISFGLAHIIQGWRSALIITMFALGFHGIVWLSGSLYIAMAVHVVYDITAGLTYGKLGRELGYHLDPPGAPAAASSRGSKAR